MPFEIIRNDLANVTADVIVNTANPRPVIGSGTDAAIHHKAGPELLEVRKKIGNIPVGQCAITPAFGLDAKFVIHTVGPVWQGGTMGEAQLLASCFRSCLELALEYGCSSVAFPLISTGTYGFPREEALQIAVRTFSSFLMGHDIHIYLVVWDKDAFRLSKSLFDHVRSYIDEHYIEEKRRSFFSFPSNDILSRRQRDDREVFSYDLASFKKAPSSPSQLPPLPVSASRSTADLKPKASPRPTAPIPPETMSLSSLDDLLKNTDAGFTETLLKLIDKTGKKDSEIYKKANVSKQHFSKIRNNPDYKPTKATALAFAIALELDLHQTRDLIGRAGYALTNSSKFDVIIMYFISQKNYDMFDINMTLFRFDQMTLGV